MRTHFLVDTAVLTCRTLLHVARSIDTVITTVLMSIAMLVGFVSVFGGEFGVRSPADMSYLLPGILMITVASCISYTAFRLFMDMKRGICERFLSMPIARSAVLWAHVVTSLVSTAVSLTIVTVVAVLMGMRTRARPAAWLAIAGMLLIVMLALAWLSVIAGLIARSSDGASAYSYPLIGIPLFTSAYLPVASMPEPLRWFAQHQPVTAILDAMKSLLVGQPVSGTIWPALACVAGVMIVAYALAMLIYRRRVV